MPIELIPINQVDREKVSSLLRQQLRDKVEGKKAIMVFVGKMREFIQFRNGHVVRDRRGDYELDVLFEWGTVSSNGTAALSLAGDDSSHVLYLNADGVWREAAGSANSERLELLFLRDDD
jgi:hypothetical protein